MCACAIGFESVHTHSVSLILITAFTYIRTHILYIVIYAFEYSVKD